MEVDRTLVDTLYVYNLSFISYYLFDFVFGMWKLIIYILKIFCIKLLLFLQVLFQTAASKIVPKWFCAVILLIIVNVVFSGFSVNFLIKKIIILVCIYLCINLDSLINYFFPFDRLFMRNMLFLILRINLLMNLFESLQFLSKRKDCTSLLNDKSLLLLLLLLFSDIDSLKFLMILVIFVNYEQIWICLSKFIILKIVNRVSKILTSW